MEPPVAAAVGPTPRLTELLDSVLTGDFNQALLDLASAVCTPRSPACPVFSWSGPGAAYAAGDPARYP